MECEQEPEVQGYQLQNLDWALIVQTFHGGPLQEVEPAGARVHAKLRQVAATEPRLGQKESNWRTK